MENHNNKTFSSKTADSDLNIDIQSIFQVVGMSAEKRFLFGKSMSRIRKVTLAHVGWSLCSMALVTLLIFWTVFGVMDRPKYVFLFFWFTAANTQISFQRIMSKHYLTWMTLLLSHKHYFVMPVVISSSQDCLI